MPSLPNHFTVGQRVRVRDTVEDISGVFVITDSLPGGMYYAEETVPDPETPDILRSTFFLENEIEEVS